MRPSAACLTLLFILSLSVVSMTSLQAPKAQTTTAKYYLQPGESTSVPNVQLGLHAPGGDWFGKWNMTVFNMDTPAPNGPLVVCSWCDFATRPLVSAHTFKSFKLHLYVRWAECALTYALSSFNVSNWGVVSVISLAIGSGPADFSRIGYGYEDALRPIGGKLGLVLLDLALSGYQIDIMQTAQAAVNRGNRLVFHFGIRPTMLGEDAPCGSAGATAMVHPTILFGDPEHASYIETDAVELQGQPIVATITTVASTTMVPILTTTQVTTAPTSTPIIPATVTVTAKESAPIDFALLSMALSVVAICLVVILAVVLLRRRGNKP